MKQKRFGPVTDTLLKGSGFMGSLLASAFAYKGITALTEKLRYNESEDEDDDEDDTDEYEEEEA